MFILKLHVVACSRPLLPAAGMNRMLVCNIWLKIYVSQDLITLTTQESKKKTAIHSLFDWNITMAAAGHFGAFTTGATGSAQPWPMAANTTNAPRPDVSLRSASRGRSAGEAASAARHGSGARFGIHRPGSRERPRHFSASHAQEAQHDGNEVRYRAVPAGQQEEMDWAAALDRVANTISTNERHLRNHAQAIALIEGKLNQVITQATEVVETIPVIQQKVNDCERHLGEACSNIMDRYELKIEAIHERGAFTARLDTLALELRALMNAHMDMSQRVPVTETHDMSTPVTSVRPDLLRPPVPPGIDPLQTSQGDAWAQHNAPGRTSEIPVPPQPN